MVLHHYLLLACASVIHTREIVHFSSSDHENILSEVYGSDGEGRSNLGDQKEKFKELLLANLDRVSYLPVRLVAKALSIGVQLERAVIPVRGPASDCHFAEPCLDLACGKCFDPMTSLHGDCGALSYFRCSSILPSECLPWTCSTGDNAAKAILRNFLPRSAGCGITQLQLVSSKNLPSNVELTGLGLTMNSLTSCSEKPACWDESCGLCYDPLEQYHAPCPPLLSVQRCSALPPACAPVICWPKDESGNTTVQVTPVILRDFQPKDVSSLVCKV